MLSADAMVIQVEADRVVQLAYQKFDECYKGEPNEVLGNLYAKAGDVSKGIIVKADELHTCLVLIEEMEKEKS